MSEASQQRWTIKKKKKCVKKMCQVTPWQERKARSNKKVWHKDVRVKGRHTPDDFGTKGFFFYLLIKKKWYKWQRVILQKDTETAGVVSQSCKACCTLTQSVTKLELAAVIQRYVIYRMYNLNVWNVRAPVGRQWVVGVLNSSQPISGSGSISRSQGACYQTKNN